MKTVIAIDGPAGSGKGTIAKKLAERLNLIYIDSGATYRCVALSVLENNININDERSIVKLASTLNIDFKSGKTFLNGKDVSELIRTKEVTKIVSPISSIVELRSILVELQRKMAQDNDVVMEGRDITTVVFPNANYKFYLDASTEVRAERRYKELKEKGINMTFDEVIENIKSRDYNDMNKPVGALIRTEEQIYIDTTNMNIDEVVEKMIEKIGVIK